MRFEKRFFLRRSTNVCRVKFRAGSDHEKHVCRSVICRLVEVRTLPNPVPLRRHFVGRAVSCRVPHMGLKQETNDQQSPLSLCLCLLLVGCLSLQWEAVLIKGIFYGADVCTSGAPKTFGVDL